MDLSAIRMSFPDENWMAKQDVPLDGTGPRQRPPPQDFVVQQQRDRGELPLPTSALPSPLELGTPSPSQGPRGD